jgi:hypothetical protein
MALTLMGATMKSSAPLPVVLNFDHLDLFRISILGFRILETGDFGTKIDLKFSFILVTR